MSKRRKTGLVFAAVVGASVALAGCAQQSGPTQIGFAGGGSCQSVRDELNKLDRMGVPSKIESHSAGKRLSPESMAQVNRYNSLLEQYLGNQCQLPPS